MIKAIQVVIALMFGLTGGAAIEEVRANAKHEAMCEMFAQMSLEELSAMEI